MLPSNHVARQQKVRNPLLNRILVLAAAADQLAVLHVHLHQQRVQVLQRLRRLALFRHEILRVRRAFGQAGETELRLCQCSEVLIDLALRGLYFFRNGFKSFPVDPGEQILDEQGVDLGFDLFELGFSWVQGEGGRVGFAGFAGAGEEVEGEELHLWRPGILVLIKGFF